MSTQDTTLPPLEALAHRIAWRYKKSSDPNHSDTYTFNSATLHQFAAAIAAQAPQPLAPAPSTFDLTEARAIVVDAIRRMRAAHVGCLDLTMKAEGFLEATHAAAKSDQLWTQTLEDRDRYHEVADKLAQAIAKHLGIDIGEHSSANCPWDRALEAFDEATEPEQAQQAQGVPARFDPLDLQDLLVAISEAVADKDDRAAQAMLAEALKLLAAAPQAEPQPNWAPETCAVCGEGKALLIRCCSHCGSEYAGLAEVWANRQAPAVEAEPRPCLSQIAESEKQTGLTLTGEPQPEREPLSPEQKYAMWVAATIELPSPENCYMRGFADAERAHGIGTKGGKP